MAYSPDDCGFGENCYEYCHLAFDFRGDPMQQDKDRSGKWLIEHFGSSILRLAGYSGIGDWKAVKNENVAPRRTPDGLLEVQFAGQSARTLVLIEIESYASADADRQVFEDIQLTSLTHDVIPETVCLVLKPRVQTQVIGSYSRQSELQSTSITASWRLVELWKLEGDQLFELGDIGLIPWIPLTHNNGTPEEVIRRCRSAIDTVVDKTDREALLVVTQILAGLAYPKSPLLQLLGGPELMLESPVLEEAKEILRQRMRVQMREEILNEVRNEVRNEVSEKLRDQIRDNIVVTLDIRFGQLPNEAHEKLMKVSNEVYLKSLNRLALTCPDIQTFLNELTTMVQRQN